jgi:DNA repair photolyase
METRESAIVGRRVPRVRGRGALNNPPNRFEKLEYISEPDEDRRAPTRFYRDDTQSIITFNKSPDVGFEASLNPYRGCEHGCAYCYARPTHEYLGFSAGLDFETRIVVKENAPALLHAELSSPRWKPQVLAMSGVTDCYQPIERQLRITRRCLEVLAEFCNPVAVITKNHLVVRDIDLLSAMARENAAAVNISITSLNPDLARKLEPRASPPSRRLAAIEELSAADIPVRLMIAPVIPGLNDHEIPSILNAAAEAGANDAGYVPVRLPFAVAPIFTEWLENHVPDQKDKVLGRIRAMRGGKLNDPNFGSRMRGEGMYAEQMQRLFEVGCRKTNFRHAAFHLSTQNFRAPQLQLL